MAVVAQNVDVMFADESGDLFGERLVVAVGADQLDRGGCPFGWLLFVGGVRTPGREDHRRSGWPATRQNHMEVDMSASLRNHISLERQELADVLSGLSARSWQEPTLCVGWGVRDVVAHATMPFRYSTVRFGAELVRARGRFNVMADRCARRDAAAMSTANLVAAVRDNADHPWKPPGGGYGGALTHEVIHGLDYTVPLGIDRRVPEDRLRIVLHDADTPKARKFFGIDLAGVALVADDMDWSRGSGEPVHGAAQHLLLALCGRRLPAGLLRGLPAERFNS